MFEGDCFLGYDGVRCDRNLVAFWGNPLSPSTGWSSNQTIKRYIPDGLTVYGQRRQNIKSHIPMFVATCLNHVSSSLM